MTSSVPESCPFINWRTISEYIPELYYLSEDKTTDFSWFTTAPKYSTFRVNTGNVSPQQVIEILQNDPEMKNNPPVCIYIHPLLPDCVVVGAREEDVEERLDEWPGEVIVDSACGSAVLRGADVFAPGILGLHPSAKAGDKVKIYADLRRKCLRGYMKKFEEPKFYVGCGILKMDREMLFKNNATPKGVGVEVRRNLSGIPRLSLPPSCGILQNLPSIVCGAQFSELTSGPLLDMCAAPGNKTSHIASLLRDKGIKVIALDKTPNKIARLQLLCSQLGLDNVQSYVYDSTKCVQGEKSVVAVEEEREGPPFVKSSFSGVLLDPPCSALGQRPTLASAISPSQLNSYLPLQRRLFTAAYEAVKEEGVLVYSTCTVTLEENEGMVAWALGSFPGLSLEEVAPRAGGPGIKVDGLTDKDVMLVRRFGALGSSTPDDDTIGFFIAKFKKIKQL